MRHGVLGKNLSALYWGGPLLPVPDARQGVNENDRRCWHTVKAAHRVHDECRGFLRRPLPLNTSLSISPKSRGIRDKTSALFDVLGLEQ